MQDQNLLNESIRMRNEASGFYWRGIRMLWKGIRMQSSSSSKNEEQTLESLENSILIHTIRINLGKLSPNKARNDDISIKWIRTQGIKRFKLNRIWFLYCIMHIYIYTILFSLLFSIKELNSFFAMDPRSHKYWLFNQKRNQQKETNFSTPLKPLLYIYNIYIYYNSINKRRTREELALIALIQC